MSTAFGAALISLVLTGAAGAQLTTQPAGAAQIVHPERIDTHLRNPWMGFVYYGGKEFPDLADVYYAMATWGEMEPAEGRFDWTPPRVKELMDQAAKRGRRVCIRIPTSWQNEPYATPKWVHDLGVARFDILEKFRDTPQFKTFHEPAWWNPVYIEKYCNFVTAMGKHFDGMPGLEFVDIRCYGTWGEGHRFPTTQPWPEDVSKRQTIVRFLDAHAAAFKKTPLAVQMACDKDTPYPEGTAIDYALKLGCWMRRDGFGQFINKDEAAAMQANWKTSLVIAENGGPLADYAAGKVHHVNSERGQLVTLDGLFDEMLAFHCNYIPLGWGDECWAVLKDRPDLLKRVWMRMGYRFAISEAKLPAEVTSGREMTVEQTWRNVGVGRLPFAYPLAFYLADDKGNTRQMHRDDKIDQTAWYEDEPHALKHTFVVPAGLSPGRYTLLAALVDRQTGKPAIALGIAGDDGQRRYPLGTLTVRPGGSGAAASLPAEGAVERRMEYLRPAEFRALRDEAPIAYLAWGSHEWHGPHLPLGTDTVKAHWLCRSLAEQTGGVVYPAVYFGYGVMGNPGKDTSLGFPKELVQQVAKHYFLKLYEKGFRVVVVVMGHYGRAHTVAMEEVVKQVEEELGGNLVIVAEPDYTWTGPEFKGDHAAANETSYMELFEPQTVDMSRLPTLEEAAKVYDLGVQGQDPRTYASAERGRRQLELLQSRAVPRIREALEKADKAAAASQAAPTAE